MTTPLKVLIVDDSEDDALLLQRELRRGGLELAAQRVESGETMRAALDKEKYDIILCDYAMPHFSVSEALALWKEIRQDIPFIVISGTVGEDVAVATMKAGAHDYLMKDNLTRLVPAVERELQEARERRRLRQAEQALQEAGLQWDATFDAIEDSIAIIDTESRLLRCNQATMKLLGKPADEIVGQTCYQLIHGTSGPIKDSPVVRMRQTRRRETLELPLGDLWYNVTVDPIFDDSGEILGAVHIVSDITERKRMAKEIEDARCEELAAKDRFISHVSHELRSPLAVAYEFVTILLDGLAGAVPDQQREYLETILRSVDQLRVMIDDLLDVSRARSGKLLVTCRYMNMHRTIGEVVTSHQTAATAKDISLSTEVLDKLPPVFADHQRVIQILTNLVGNAVKFTPPGGSITVRAETDPHDEGFIRISIADTGYGMNEEDSRKIFEEMYQAEETIDATRKGLGLGLYLCRELVTRQGGQIWATSNLGKGSTFFFTLPMFSLAEQLGPILTVENLQGGSVAIITVEASLIEDRPLMKSDESALQEVLRILERCVIPAKDVVLPRIPGAGSDEAFHVVACTDANGAEVLTERIRQQLGGGEALRAAGMVTTVSSMIMDVASLPNHATPDRIAKDITNAIETLVMTPA